MSGVLVDSNILIDVGKSDPVWGARSEAAMAASAEVAPLVINLVIYAEVSVAYASIEEVDAVIPPDAFRREAIPWEAAFLAGKCFIEYRRRGGARRSPLPDFFIGAHAAVMGYRLLTRDPQRYRSYFPTVTLIAP
jgi:predicted nucleic acid-binding protein